MTYIKVYIKPIKKKGFALYATQIGETVYVRWKGNGGGWIGRYFKANELTLI